MSLKRIVWDDLKLLLAAERSLSLAGLASELRIDPTTASRRMTQLERLVGLSLFVRSHGALRLSDEGHQLVRHALEMESAERAFRISVRKLREAPEGVIRISAPPTLARFVLGPGVPSLRQSAPNLSIDLQIGTDMARLEKLEADIAVRIGLLDDAADTLLATKLGTSTYAVFVPEHDPNPTGWIAYSKNLSHMPHAARVEEKLAGSEPVMRANDPMTMAIAVSSGAGMAVLPVTLGRAVPGIIQQGDTVLERDIWALRYPETGDTSAVRTTYDWLVSLF
jgi:DNA-binding transcriptional LysR family regulator